MNQVITLKIYRRKELSTTDVMVMTTKVERDIKISTGGVSSICSIPLFAELAWSPET
jgi:hypothetical protein